jgi:hypothetical protein
MSDPVYRYVTLQPLHIAYSQDNAKKIQVITHG